MALPAKKSWTGIIRLPDPGGSTDYPAEIIEVRGERFVRALIPGAGDQEYPVNGKPNDDKPPLTQVYDEADLDEYRYCICP